MTDPPTGEPVTAWAWPALTVADAANLTLRHLPDLRAGELEPLGEGDFCFAYRASTLVVRVAKHARAAEALRKETCVLARIEGRLPLDMPRLEYRSPEGSPPFTLHREVVGTVLTRAAWASMPATVRGRTAERLAHFLRQLHAGVDAGRACGLGRLDEAALAARLRLVAPAALATHLPPGVPDRLEAALAKRADEDAEPSLALLHGDVAPGHLLYDEPTGELTGVIDFGDVVLGPPARDFVYLYEDFGVELCKEVLEAYAGRRAGALLAEVRAWYLLEAIDWTLDCLAKGRRAEVTHGVGEITRELTS